MEKATKKDYNKEVKINTLEEQLLHFCQNASTDINKQMYDRAKEMGFTDDQLKNNPKINLYFNVKPGKLPGFNFFTWYISDKRIFKSKKRILGSVDFGPSGYVVYMQQPKIKVVGKPSLIDLTGKKLRRV